MLKSSVYMGICLATILTMGACKSRSNHSEAALRGEGVDNIKNRCPLVTPQLNRRAEQKPVLEICSDPNYGGSLTSFSLRRINLGNTEAFLVDYNKFVCRGPNAFNGSGRLTLSPVTLEKLSEAVKKGNPKRDFAIEQILRNPKQELSGIGFDPNIGGLNLLLPVIWATLAVTVPIHDAYQLFKNPGKDRDDLIRRVNANLENPDMDYSRINVDFSIMKFLDEAFQDAVKNCNAEELAGS